MKIIDIPFISGDVFIGISTLMLFSIMVFCIYDTNRDTEEFILSDQTHQIIIDS